MFSRCVWLFVLMFVCSPAFAAPDLAAAYAKPSAGIAMTLLKQEDGSPSREFSAPGTGEPVASGPSVGVVVDDVRAEALRLDYERGLRLHRTGNILTVAGAAVSVVSAFGVFVGAFSGDPTLVLISGLGLVAGGGSYITGGVLSSLGAINATRAVNEVLGIQLGYGTGYAGIVMSTAGLLLSPVAGLGLFGPLVGVICGVVQLQSANRALSSAGLASLHVVPSRNGLQVVGRF